MNLYLDKSWTFGSVFFSLGQFFCLSQDRLKHQCDLFRGVSQDEYPSLFPSTTCHIHHSAWVCKISKKMTFISKMAFRWNPTSERTIYNWKSFQSLWRLGSDWRLCPGILSLSSLQKYSNLEDLVIPGLESESNNIVAFASHSSGAAGPSWSFSLPRSCRLLLRRLQLLQDFHAQVCRLSKSVSWLLFICQCGNLL